MTALSRSSLCSHTIFLAEGALCPAILDRISPTEDTHVWEIDTDRCPTRAELFAEFATTLSFPNYFGRNWDAFQECMGDLDWLNGENHIIVFRRAHGLLKWRKRPLTILFHILDTTGPWWANEHLGCAFKVILECRPADTTAFVEVLKESGVEFGVIKIPENRTGSCSP